MPGVWKTLVWSFREDLIWAFRRTNVLHVFACIIIKLAYERQGKMASSLFDWLLISLLANGMEQRKDVPSSLVLSSALNCLSWNKFLDIPDFWFP